MDNLVVATAPKVELTEGTAYKTYWKKWGVLLAMCLLSGFSAFIWLATQSVLGVVMDVYQIDALQANLIPVSYEAAYVPFSILSTFFMERYGLRKTLLVAAFALLLTAWLRYGGTLIQETNPSGAWGLILGGTWIAACGQPFVLNVAARVSADWFAPEQRALATVIGTMSNGVGQLLGSLIPPYVVLVGSDMPPYMLGQAIVATVLVVITLLFVFDRPPTPPSAETELQWKARDEAMAANPDALSREALRAMWADAKAMWKSKNFFLLALSFPLVIGMFWAVLTVEWSLVTPCGYDAQTAGAAGAVALGVGIISSFISAPVIEKLQAYVPLQIGTTFSAILAAIFILGVNKPGSPGLVIAAWACLGFVIQPLLPISLEHAAEITYPIFPDSSTSILFSLANIYALVITYILTPLLSWDVSLNCDSVITPAAGCIFFGFVLAFLFILPVKKEYKRIEAAKATAVSKALGNDPEGGAAALDGTSPASNPGRDSEIDSVAVTPVAGAKVVPAQASGEAAAE